MSERFENFGINQEEIKTLLDLEEVIKKELKIIEIISMDSFGITIKNKNVIGLGLYNCDLESFPEPILKLQSLQKLNLANNKLQKLPLSISNLTMLRKLDLSLNGLISIPDSIGKCKSLKSIILVENNLKNLPKSIGDLIALKKLILNNNKLKKLPKSIGNLTSLERLEMDNNDLISLPESIGNLTYLISLFLSNNKLSSLPWTIWKLQNWKYYHLDDNSWKDEWIELVRRDLPSIREFCRKRASINVFLSHAVQDQHDFRIKDISEYLEDEEQEEIYKAYYCEEHLKGNIDDFMNETVPKCQLLLFFASNKSMFHSLDCTHELELARKHNIQIIPIKGKDIDWPDLKAHDLDRELGHDFNDYTFKEFCEKIYKYIKQFKRDINLFVPEEAKIDREKLNIKNLINRYLDSVDFKEILKGNFGKFKEIFQKVSYDKISINEYLDELNKIILKKVEVDYLE